MTLDTDRAAWRPAGPIRPLSNRPDTWVALLFMVGSACFAIASVPGFAVLVGAGVAGAIYFVGSLFFTSAALLLAAQTWRELAGPRASTRALARVLRSPDWWAAMVQLVGTLWFNINTYDAMRAGLSAHETNLRVWTPDFLGSICFLVSSYVSWVVFCRRPCCVSRASRPWWIATLNLVGSLFFMASALAAFTLPATGQLLDSSLADSGTLLGALCFLWAARLLIGDERRPGTQPAE